MARPIGSAGVACAFDTNFFIISAPLLRSLDGVVVDNRLFMFRAFVA